MGGSFDRGGEEAQGTPMPCGIARFMQPGSQVDQNDREGPPEAGQDQEER